MSKSHENCYVGNINYLFLNLFFYFLSITIKNIAHFIFLITHLRWNAYERRSTVMAEWRPQKRIKYFLFGLVNGNFLLFISAIVFLYYFLFFLSVFTFYRIAFSRYSLHHYGYLVIYRLSLLCLIGLYIFSCKYSFDVCRDREISEIIVI